MQIDNCDTRWILCTQPTCVLPNGTRSIWPATTSPKCRGAELLLAHLQHESVTVEEGQDVTTGQRLGRVGNTGNTTEPHLHVRAVDADTGDVLYGAPVPTLFDRRVWSAAYGE